MNGRVMRRALAACVVALAVLTSAAAGAQSDLCQQKIEVLSSEHNIALKTISARLNEADRGKVMGWASCDTPHMDLTIVVEQAIRRLDSQNTTEDGGLELFISPGQNVTIHDPENAFARSELVETVTRIPQARGYAANLLGPGAGQGTWQSVMMDLNAETHALKTSIELKKGGLVGDDFVDNTDELSTVLLVAAAYVSHAKERYPDVFEKMGNSAASVDALRLLWTRAQETVIAAHEAGLGGNAAPIIASIDSHKPSLLALFDKVPGVEAPDFKTALEPRKEAARPSDVPAPDKGTAAQSDPPSTTDSPSKDKGPRGAEAAAAEGLGEPKVEPKTEPPPSTGGEAKPREKVETKPTEPAQGDAERQDVKDPQDPAAKKSEEAEGLDGADKARIAAAASLLLLPWLFVLALVFFKRRRPSRYVRLANRGLALSVFLVVVECLCLVLVTVFGELGAVFSLDGLFLIAPPYFMGVTLMMLAKIDTEGQLASRQLLKKWSKWVALAVGLIVVANIILVPTVFMLTPHFIVGPSMIVIAIIAIIFLIKLWRTGDQPEAAEGPSPEAPAGDNEEVSEARQAPVVSTRPATPDLPAEPTAGRDVETASAEQAPPNPAAEMSDEALAAALDLLDGDGDAEAAPSELSDEDRDNLYKLLGDD